MNSNEAVTHAADQKPKQRLSRRNGVETADRLLEAALRLLWTKSYGAVSVDDICDLAEIRKGSFYHFFPSKAALAVAAIRRYAEESRSGLDSIFSATQPPIERLERFCESVYLKQQELAKSSGHVCGCPMMSLGSELSAVEDEVRDASAELGRRMVAYLESAVRDAVAQGVVQGSIDPASKAEELNALLVGFVTQARVKNTVEPLLRLWPAMRASLGLHG